MGRVGVGEESPGNDDDSSVTVTRPVVTEETQRLIEEARRRRDGVKIVKGSTDEKRTARD